MVDLSRAAAGAPLVLAVHGTRDPAGTRVSHELRNRVAERLPGVGVHLGWADLLTPTLTETLDALGGCVVVPVFLTTGYHVAHDVPQAIAAGGGRATLTGRVGDDLLAAVADRLAEAGGPGDAVVLGAAGSRRAESVDEVRTAAGRLAELLGRPVEAAFLTAAEPTVPDAVAALRARGFRDVTVASYLLAPGTFHTRLREVAPGRVSEPIGAHPLLVTGVADRYRQAMKAQEPHGAADPLLIGLDLRERQVLLVGAGTVAERRLTDLLAAGALVRVVAPAAGPRVADLAAGASIEWRRRAFEPADLDGVWLAHTATGDPVVDAAVAHEAERRRVWCVQAGRAAEGTARIAARASLGTAEGPVSVGVLAGGDPRRARAVRDRVQGLLDAGDVEARARRPRRKGWVALVGGGPGDPALITGRGRSLLASADVVLADRLAPAEVETLCPQAEVIDVGKSVGRHSVPQEAINELIVAHGLAGRAVVRLKGGDPYVFGRGGEERLAAEAAGLSVEVVPGISSAVAVPAAAGIPVTHRGLADGYTVVHGHGGVRDVPGGRDHTVVILMGVAALRDVADALAAGSRGPGCPVAVVESGCTPRQRVTVGELATIADRADAVGVRAPAVIVVGDVVTLSAAWAGREASAPAASAVRRRTA